MWEDADTSRVIVERLQGRARFCKDRGEIKTPDLLFKAAATIARLRGIIDDLTATYPLTLSEAQARVDAARNMMEGL